MNNTIQVFNKKISHQKKKSYNKKSIIQFYINFFLIFNPKKKKLFLIKTKENVKNFKLVPYFQPREKKEAEGHIG